MTSLAVLMAVGLSAKAQEVTVNLIPGWTWISYPHTEVMDIETVLGDFVPMQGDIIKSQFSQTVYINGQWVGGLRQFTPGIGYKYYSNRTEDVEFVFAQASNSVVTTATPTDITATSAVVGGTVTVPEGGHVFLRGVCWGTEPNPDIDGNHITHGEGIGDFNDTLVGLTPSTTYYVRAYVVTDHGLAYGENLSFVADYGYVDLGLPSGTLWATCNVGADTPEGYGDYFAWGETQPKDYYDWSTYQYCNGSYTTMTKYCDDSSYGYNGFTDNLTTLQPEDDAATANWGADWRMPTTMEWQELLENTTITWTTRNGVTGRLFTASNGNSLFLPAASYYDGSSLIDAGVHGRYWSNSINEGNPYGAWNYGFGPDGYSMYGYDRYCGQSVRAVRYVSFNINTTTYPTDGGTVTGDGTYRQGQSCTLTATANAGYYFVNWTEEDGEEVSTDATYTFTVQANRTLVANFAIAHDYVDLGLPSGTLWATCNVGADTPEGYGDYFAWGETQPKSNYDWDTYQYCNGSDHTLSKYCYDSSYGYNGFTDTLITLLPEDDAVTANWGEDWRMPSKKEWLELHNNTTYIWTTQNGVKGRLFTAANGNSLFLPAAGYRRYNNLSYAGSGGAYWSSSLQMDSPIGAWDVGFSSGNYILYYGRSCGQSVRAVRCKNSVIEVSAASTECGEVSGGGTYVDRTNCTVTATANEGYSFICWSEYGETVSTEATYTFMVSGNRSLVAYFYNYTSGAYTYIDLGLPNGTLWATCNVGSDTPEGYGSYFAWGETQPKSTYDWSTYQHCNGSNRTLTKYCNNSYYGYNGFTDDLTILLPEDDAAMANWGGEWRMPTSEEWQELMDNTINTVATINGNKGRLFIATNGNGLFLPAAGYIDDNGLDEVGSSGDYWSSSLNTSTPYYAWNFRIYMRGYDMFSSNYRDSGRPVRAVRSGSQNVSFNINTTTHPTDSGTVTGDGTYQQGQNCTLTATANTGYYFVNWTENGEVVSTDATYTFTVQADRTLVANFTYNCEYVDLGLPSGTLWAICNVGADAPEDYGDYFAWGETQPKSTYNWSTYQYCNGSNTTLTKYCNNSSYGYNGFTDNLTTLQPEDDAATANWGSDWRMPTKEEWQELYNNTTCTWTQQNGVNGRLFTASNGNTLFLPAAGCRYGSSLYDAGSYGYYWSSSLITDSPYGAWRFYFNSGHYGVGNYYRRYGHSVRAVCSGLQN